MTLASGTQNSLTVFNLFYSKVFIDFKKSNVIAFSHIKVQGSKFDTVKSYKVNQRPSFEKHY